MKNKKIFVYIVICALAAGFLSSCAIDRKCPAYSKVETTNQQTIKA